MFATCFQWLDNRTGYRKLRDALLIEHIPGGARWRYVWGSCLAFVFSVQLITGLLLMTAYSPGDSTAWSSVYYIQYAMDFGWLIRGLHHFGSQTMVVLLGVHMLQVVIAGAHLPPREVNWWLGLALLACVLGLSLTGYLLPWDQKGYWATQVATTIAGNLPVLGPGMQKLVVGGPVYGHHTLTRFFALHVAILPPIVIGLIAAHLAVFRRHGVTAPANAVGEGWFWPDQAFRDMVASMLIFAVMLGLVLYGHGHPLETPAADSDASAVTVVATESPGLWGRIRYGGRYGLGANLDAPADPAQPYPARPEWYFLFLFQLLKYFPGESEIIGTVLIPGVAGLVLFVVPLLGYGRWRKFGHVFGVVLIASMLAGIGALTYMAIADDNAATAEGETLRREMALARKAAHRAVQLAARGVPADGAVQLLRRDPQTRGRELFQMHCAGCHSHTPNFDSGTQAADLAGFGSEQWIRDLLRDPAAPRFFGHTKLRRMAKWIEEGDGAAVPPEDMDRIARWLAGHPRGLPADETSEFARGYDAFLNHCNSCHTYEPEPGEEPTDFPGPDFTGYGSAEWIRRMIMAPGHRQRYGSRNAMPAFRNIEGPGGELVRMEHAERDPDTPLQQLGELERELIIRWLTGDDDVVFGGDPLVPSRKP